MGDDGVRRPEQHAARGLELAAHFGAQWSHCAVVPLYVLYMSIAGIRPLSPGFSRFEIRPQLADLEQLDLVAHTVRGPFDSDCAAGWAIANCASARRRTAKSNCCCRATAGVAARRGRGNATRSGPLPLASGADDNIASPMHLTPSRKGSDVQNSILPGNPLAMWEAQWPAKLNSVRLSPGATQCPR